MTATLKELRIARRGRRAANRNPSSNGTGKRVERAISCSPASKHHSRPSDSSSPTHPTSCAPPLTLERTLLELALSDPNAGIDSYRDTCEQLLAVGEQQERLIEALLTLSRGQRGLESHQPVDIAAITAAAAAASAGGSRSDSA